MQSVIETPAGTLVIVDYSLDDYSYEELVTFYEDFSGGDGMTVLGRLASETTPKSVSWFLDAGGEQYDVTVHDGDDAILVQMSVSPTG